MKKHYNITIKGRVQGVFFRGAAKNTAKNMGITGFIKNNYDGTVYIETESDTYSLNQFVKWCKIGPDRAIVKEVIVTEGKLKNFSSFKIIH